MYVKYETDEEELQKIWDNIHNELKERIWLSCLQKLANKIKDNWFLLLKENCIYRFLQNF